MAALEAGLDFGGYVLERRLGIGGMAEVWAARSREPGSPTVALKLLAEQHAKDPSYVAMFIDEAALGARLRHRATVPIETCFQANDTFCQVMPLVEGRDLRRVFIDAQKRRVEFPGRSLSMSRTRSRAPSSTCTRSRTREVGLSSSFIATSRRTTS